MINIDLLSYRQFLRTRFQDSTSQIFDPIRRLWVAITPEELVRQLFLHYSIDTGISPQSLISVEKKITVNTLERRYDLAFHETTGQPWLLVECKAAEVPLAQEAFNQVARYNLTMRVPYLVLTNGVNTWCCKIDFENASWEMLSSIPTLEDHLRMKQGGAP